MDENASFTKKTSTEKQKANLIICFKKVIATMLTYNKIEQLWNLQCLQRKPQSCDLFCLGSPQIITVGVFRNN